MRVHAALGPRTGVSDEEIDFLRSGRQAAVPKTLGFKEQLVIEYAEQLTRTGTTTDALDSRMRDLGLTPRERVELAAVVAIANASARLENALKIEEE